MTSLRNKQILKIAVPSIISNITVPLLGLVDVAIVGHMGDAAYIGAIAIGSMLFNVIYWIFGFLRMGTSGMTSQALGRRELSEVMRLLVRSVSVAIGIACCFLLLQVPLRETALWLMNTPADAQPLVRSYFNICIWGAPAMLGLYGLSGWYIGMQNTRIPMIVAIVQNIVNIVVSMCLVFGLKMNIEGAATGTLVAQWVGFLLAVILWYHNYRRLYGHLSRQGLFTRQAMLRFFQVNSDIFIRTLGLVAVNMFFTSAGARQGSTILAVNTLLMTLFTLYSYFLDGFAYAGEALGGRYWGSGNRPAFCEITRSLFIWGGVVMLLFTVVYALTGSHFLRLLTDNETVVRASLVYFPWAIVIPLSGMAAFLFDGLFIGMTETRGMMVSSLVATAVFFSVYYLLQPLWGNHALWFSFVIYLLMRGLLQGWIFKRQIQTIGVL